MSEEPIFHPLTWCIWLGMGLISLAITVGVAALFGSDPIDVLLLREDRWDIVALGDYFAIAVGIWLAFRQMQSGE